MTTNPVLVLHIKSPANHANIFTKHHRAKEMLTDEESGKTEQERDGEG